MTEACWDSVWLGLRREAAKAKREKDIAFYLEAQQSNERNYQGLAWQDEWRQMIADELSRLQATSRP